MIDMRQVIQPKSDQLNADDLIAGPMTIRITEVVARPGTEQPVSIYFDGDNGKPYKPCKSMCRVMVQAWGPDGRQYVGKSMTLYRDPAVKWAGLEIGGIRISHLSDISGTMTMALTATKGSRKIATIHPLQVSEPAGDTITFADAVGALRGAGSMDELERVWKKRGMGPFRDDLADELEAAKQRLTPAPSDAGPSGAEQVEETAQKPAADGAAEPDDPFQTALADIGRAEIVPDVNSRVATWTEAFGSNEAAVSALRQAGMDRIAALKGGVA